MIANLKSHLRRHLGSTKRQASADRSRRRLVLDVLEERSLLTTLIVGPNVNISTRTGNQAEQAVAINPTNPLNLASMTNDDAIGSTGGMFFADSFDGGKTWRDKRLLGDGSGGLAISEGDPSLAFDAFGNLYASSLSPLASGGTNVAVYLSQDGGKTFTQFANVTGAADQPSIRTGPGDTAGSQSVWVVYNDKDGDISASGAKVTGLGQVGTFATPEKVPGSTNLNYGDIEIGQNGQVMVVEQDNTGGGGVSNIYTALDPDGLGPLGFTAAKLLFTSNVGGIYPLPAMSGSYGIDAEVDVAYDKSGGPHRGRVYLGYVTAPANGSADTNIDLMYSDDDGATWSSPTQVNDDKTTTSQFNPAIAVDPISGNLGLDWLDCREDPTTNFKVKVYATASLDGGKTFLPDVAVSQYFSTQDNGTPAPGLRDLDYGDYGAIAFYNNTIYCVWADNSAQLGGNPDLPHFDLAGASVTLQGLVTTSVNFSATEARQFTGVVATLKVDTPGTPASAFSATINWGDGTISAGSVVLNGGIYSIIGTHTYLEGGNYVVAVSVLQTGGGTASTTSTVTVIGLPLNASGTALSLNEGDGYSGILAHFVDTAPTAQTASHYTATINFGDGSLGTGTIVASPTGGFDVYDQGGHIYGGGNYNVVVTISDPGTTTTATTTAIVIDSALHAAGTDITPLEGTPFTFPIATFTDDDPRIPPLSNYYATVDWGDGTTSSGPEITFVPNPNGPGFAVEASHPYGVGSYSIVVTIGNFSGGNTAVALSTAVVQDAPLIAQGYNFSPLAGTSFSGFLASFTDLDPRSNPASNYSAKVDWGDGTKEAATVVINEDGGYLVQGSHAYRAGNFVIMTTIMDLGGAQTVTTGTATVPDAPITPVGTNNPTIGEGVSVQTLYAVFQTNNLLSPATDYSAAITLDDGTLIPATVFFFNTTAATPDTPAYDTFFVLSDASYDLAGVYPYSVVLTSPGGSQVVSNGSITVTAAPVNAQGTIVSGTSKTPLASVTVATFTSGNPKATASEYSAIINWGDNTASAGTVASDGLGGFLVLGSHTYPSGGSFITAVTINGSGGISSTVQGTAVISNLITPISGGATTTTGGVISETGLTNSSTPIFKGKTEPLATVHIFATAAGGAAVQVATGTADATGSYTIVSSPIADGQYTIVASATDAAGNPSSNPTILYPTASRGLLTVDTQGPKVGLATLNPRTGKVTITLTDGLSGLGSGVLQANNFSLQGSNGRFFAVTGISVSPVSPNTLQTVTLTFATTKPLPKGTYILRINAPGVADRAGNGLDERYFVPFPSFYQPGNNYVAAFNTNGKTASNAIQYVPPKEVLAAKNHGLFVRNHFRRK